MERTNLCFSVETVADELSGLGRGVEEPQVHRRKAGVTGGSKSSKTHYPREISIVLRWGDAGQTRTWTNASITLMGCNRKRRRPGWKEPGLRIHGNAACSAENFVVSDISEVSATKLSVTFVAPTSPSRVYERASMGTTGVNLID